MEDHQVAVVIKDAVSPENGTTLKLAVGVSFGKLCVLFDTDAKDTTYMGRAAGALSFAADVAPLTDTRLIPDTALAVRP